MAYPNSLNIQIWDIICKVAFKAPNTDFEISTKARLVYKNSCQVQVNNIYIMRIVKKQQNKQKTLKK